ncbi:hypothetical protein M408DRAFT_333089 [Serendipita vermifera MAFF 305830]|uniref:Ubiquitin-like domain-containing protein n=1 Tax=Serendipita vermifera MAFF 305830 TaxID=933852 RepID=A0A0C3AS58_SERVB|nr:hypothetical protein M408DRAFT_333089 [Serendipita vermifera MAFF 305830]
MVLITIEGSKKKIKGVPDLPYSLSFPDPSSTTIEDVKKLLAVKFPKMPVERMRLTLPPTSTEPGAKGKAPADNDSLVTAGLESGGTLYLKDLGPQASWTTVFVIEYAGPLFIHFLVYNYFPWIVQFKKSKMQIFAYWMFMLHFLKRELETLFVHRFSHATMPAMYIIRNSAHYWLLAGLMSAVSLYGPWNSLLRMENSGSWRDEDWFLWTCAGVWAAFEAMNLSTHLTLRSLRPAGTKARGIPQGWIFDTLKVRNSISYTQKKRKPNTRPNQTNYAGIIYVLVGTATMTKWALAKHANYRKQFGGAYPPRKAIFPGIL